MTQSSQPNSKTNSPSNSVDFFSHSAEQTRRAGGQLAQLLGSGDLVLLDGELGAGKTTFTKGLAEGLGVQGYVNSPTFTLVNQYTGRLPVYHLDCYRLESGREALDFGIEEYFFGDGVTIIEWPEKIEEILPKEFIRIRLGYLTETKRTILLEPSGQRYINILQEFKKKAFGGLPS